MGKYTKQFDARIQLTDKKNYKREQYQSFMTTPEWRNVEIAEEFAQLLKDNKSMFHFPYFRQTFDLWKILFRSYSAARKYNSMSAILFSEYMLMDLFVVLFTSFELLPKGIISLLLYPFFKKNNPTDFQKHLAHTFIQYAQGLQNTAFYNQSYERMHADLAQKYNQCLNRTWIDWCSWTIVSAELKARSWISKPLRYFFSAQNQDETLPYTEILVKFDAINCSNADTAKAEFKQRLDKLVQHHDVSLVNEHLYAKNNSKTKNDQVYLSVYARLRVSRYAAFNSVVRELAKERIYLRTIGGQERIQIKCTIDTDSEDNLALKEEHLLQTKKIQPLFSYQNHIKEHHKICLFDVPIRNLHKTIERIEKEKEVTVSFIHNF